MAAIRILALTAVLLAGCDRGDRRAISDAARNQVEIAADDAENLAEDAKKELGKARTDLSGDASNLADEVDFDRNARPTKQRAVSPPK